MTRPLFVPLKTKYFLQFKRGTKLTELRRGSDPRWSAKHCVPGRAAVLSKGYGKVDRLTAIVARHSVHPVKSLPPKERQDFIDCFGEDEPTVAIIGFKNIGPMELTT